MPHSSSSPTNQPLVSIVIATYKTPIEYIKKTIESALFQTWKNLEILVSDDSPEAIIRDIVEDYQDDRIHYSHNSPSLGPAENHWQCFQKAKGDYIAVLNHDDFWEESFIEKLIQPLIQDQTLAISFCDHWIVNTEGDRLLEDTDKNTIVWGRKDLAEGKHEVWAEMLSAQAIPMVMGAIFRKDLFPKIPSEKIGPAYDLWMTYLLNQEGYGVYYTSERLSNYRTHPSNLSSQVGIEWPHGAAECWKAVSKDRRLKTIHSIARKQSQIKFIACAKNSWILGYPFKCSYFGWQSLTMSFSIKGLIATFLLPLLPNQLGPYI
jgi:glycosyltransferase involved in cell wall biosynthesis